MAKILIVDDSSFARSNLRRMLEEVGHSISEADSGLSALEIARRVQPALITLDLLMPEMGGEEVLGHLLDLVPQAKIVVISADVQKMTREALLTAGAHGFVEKPYDKEKILAAIEDLLI